MTSNYFAIERENGKSVNHITIRDDEGNVVFEDLMSMTYEEVKSYKDLEAFIVTTMDVSNEFFGGEDCQTCITLVGEDGVFIWGILIGPGDENGDIRYNLIDWHKDGRSYKYAE